MNLSPVLILFGLAFFSGKWGIVSVFLAVPLLATLNLLLSVPTAHGRPCI